MAIVVLVSTMSFSVNMHYCGSILVETSLNVKAEGCGMEMQKPSSQECSLVKKHCCSNEKKEVKGQDELQFHSDQFNFNDLVIAEAIIYTYHQLFQDPETNLTSFKVYRPPLLRRSIFKLDETYLI